MLFRASARRALAACGAAVATRSPCCSRTEQPPAAAGSWSPSWRWFEHGELRAPRQPGPGARSDEPTYTAAEVLVRNGEGGAPIWVTYRGGVYDITDYVHEHPGGPLILQGAGGPVEGFWAHWMQHHLSTKVQYALARLRVGRLADPAADAVDEEARTGGGPWADEQEQAGRAENRLHTRRYCEMPYVSETKAVSVAPDYFTPSRALFVRNHAPVPQVPPGEAEEHLITFCLEEEEVATLSLAELSRRFPSLRVASVIQCSGNRGADNVAANGAAKSGFVGGSFEHIGLGLLGNASWGGVRLFDVVQALFPGAPEGSHVTFEGLDGYSTSTPLSYIMDPKNDCMLATEMNGTALTPDHGFPVRALLPGITGARNVKWVSRVCLGASECSSGWNRMYYKDPPTQASLQELPMNSVILSPEPGAVVAQAVSVRGVAYPGGTGRQITAVELSADRGQSWQVAVCHRGEVPADDSSRPHGWVRFSAEVTLPPVAGGIAGFGNPLSELWCRACNDGGEVQLEVSPPHGGYFYNGYHKVPVVQQA